MVAYKQLNIYLQMSEWKSPIEAVLVSVGLFCSFVGHSLRAILFVSLQFCCIDNMPANDFIHRSIPRGFNVKAFVRIIQSLFPDKK